MHRSWSDRSSQESAGPRPRRDSARAAARCRASGVNGGSRPSAGSVIKDVRLAFMTFDPESHHSRSPVERVAIRSLSICSSKAAASCSVRTSFPASSLGRSNGVRLAKFQVPCRSGSPQTVCGSLHVSACPSRAIGASEEIAMNVVRTPNACQPHERPRPYQSGMPASYACYGLSAEQSRFSGRRRMEGRMCSMGLEPE